MSRNIRYEAVKVLFLHNLYLNGLIAPFYTKTNLMPVDPGTRTLTGCKQYKHLCIWFGVAYYLQEGTKHHALLTATHPLSLIKYNTTADADNDTLLPIAS